MGILNLTPDSFSDGGRYQDPGRALDRALELEAEGADILDVGGESSRPGSRPIPEDEELRRVLPILERLGAALKIPISVDTYRAGVARRAMGAGAQVINDISGFRLDPGMAEVVRGSGAGVVLMHSRGTREALHEKKPGDSPEAIRSDLGVTVAAALQGGIAPEAIVIDPGIGFSKAAQTSLKVLKSLDVFSTLGYPLLLGPSRKSFINMGIPVSAAAVWATAAAVVLAVSRGAHIVRVHDVAPMRVAVDVADRVETA
jgi:dihydropteroate synthase